VNGVIDSGLDEWKEIRAESNSYHASEHRARELFERAFQVGHGYSLVYHEDIDLMERVVVRGIHGLVPKAAAGSCYSKWGLPPAHHSSLQGGRLRAEQVMIVDIKGHLLIERRMVRRIVQRFEVVGVFFQLGTIDKLVSQPGQYLFHSDNGLREWMSSARRKRPARESYIYLFCLKSRLKFTGPERGATPLEGFR
jgi:hypothetical protein